MATFELQFNADEGNVPGVLDKIKTKGKDVGETLSENWDKITLAGGAAGLAIEGFARTQQDANVQTRQLAESLGMSEKEVRNLATEMSDATFPLEDVLDLMELGRQRGLDSADALKDYANFWDMVGDATGNSGPVLAEAGVALQQMGIAAGDEGEALAAFGFITEETTQEVGEFLNFIERMGPDLQTLGLDIDDTAAILGAMERELGLTGRTARQEFRTAIQDADGDLDKALETLGLSEEQFKAYRDAVEDSSGVIQRNADIVGDAVTPMQRLESTAQDVMFRFGGVAGEAANLAPLLIGLGPAIKGVTIAKQGMTIAQRALNTAMRANPIGLVVTALALLVGGLIYAYQNSETFREIVDAAFSRVRDVAESVWEFISNNLLPVFTEHLPNAAATVRDFVAERISDMADTVVGIFEWVRDRPLELVSDLRDGALDRLRTLRNIAQIIIQAVYDNTVGRFLEAKDTALELVSELRDSASERFAQMRDWITSRVQALYSNVVGFAQDIIDFYRDGFRELRDTAVERFTQVRDWITSRVRRLYDSVTGYASDILTFYIETFTNLRNTVTDRASQLRDWVLTRVRAMRDFASDVVTGMRDRVVTTVTELRNTVRDRFSDLRDWVGTRVQSLYDNTVGRVLEMKDTALERVRELRDDAVGYFTDLRDDADSRIGDLLTWISNKADDIKDAVLNPFRSARDAIGDIVNGIGNNAIDALNSVLDRIETFVNTFGRAINWVADQLGLGSLVGEFTISPIPRLHSGTKNWAGGPAILHNEEMAVLPPGSRVFNAAETQAIADGIDGYGHGGMGGGLLSGIGDRLSGAWDSLTDMGRDLLSRPMNWVMDQVLDRFDLSLSLPGILSELTGPLTAILRDALVELIGSLRDLVSRESSDADSPHAPVDGWVRPTAGGITQRFGTTPFSHNYASGQHSGIDFGGSRGAPIWAANAGSVTSVHTPFAANQGGGYGNFVRLGHGGGIQTLYAHLLDSLVRVGERVNAGQQIARMDNTGFSTGDHLHFEVIDNGRAVNPANYIPLANGAYFDRPTTGLFAFAEAGDNEIVAPERKLRQIVRDELNRYDGARAAEFTINLHEDGEFRAAVTGRRLFEQQQMNVSVVQP
jgi:phage-related protein